LKRKLRYSIWRRIEKWWGNLYYGTSSVSVSFFKERGGSKRQQIKVITLEKIFKINNLKRCDFLKNGL